MTTIDTRPTATPTNNSTIYRHTLTISPRHAIAGNANALHKLVMAGFDARLEGITGTARADANILFATRRSDPKQGPPPRAAGRTSRILVQADTPGDWSHTGYTRDASLGLTVSPAWEVNTDVPAGSLVEVLVEANATRRYAPRPGAPKKSRGPRITLTHPNEVGAWATRVLHEQAGMTVDPSGMTIGAHQVLYVRREESGADRSGLTVGVSMIQAHGIVTDPAAFAQVLRVGVGRGRPYGAGLLRHRVIV